MSAVAVASIAVIGLIVAALVFYLVWVIAILGSVRRSLRQIAGAVRSIVDHSEPIGPAIDEINQDLDAIANSIDLQVRGRLTRKRARSA